MNKEYLVNKWLTDELTDAEREEFEQLDDFQLHKDILDSPNFPKWMTLRFSANVLTQSRIPLGK